MLYVYRLKNGNLRVPELLETDVLGAEIVTMKELEKGTPEWERWKDEVRAGLVIEHLDWQDAPDGA